LVFCIVIVLSIKMPETRKSRASHEIVDPLN